MQKSNFIPITLIIPVYNMQDYIEDCLQSLVSQTYKNFETVIIDDGSNDKSVEKILSFKDKLKFKLIKQKNAGLGPARNKGIKNASGKYVAFLDSDDEISHFYMEKLFKVIKSSNPDIINFSYIVDDNFLSEKTQHGMLNKSTSSSYYFKNILSMTIGSASCFKLYKKSLITNNNLYFPSILHEDLPWTYKAFFYAKKIRNINKDALYIWKKRNDSISKTLSIRHIDDFFKSFDMIQAFLKKENLWKNDAIGHFIIEGYKILVQEDYVIGLILNLKL